MKISKENNQLMVLLAVIDILLTLIFTILRLKDIPLIAYLYYPLHIISELIYLLIIYYLIRRLQSVGEKTAIQIPFYLLMGADATDFIITQIHLNFQVGHMVFAIIGAFLGFIEIYLLIVTFSIQSPELSVPFKIYGFVFMIIMIFKMSIPFIWPPTGPDSFQMSRYLGFTDLLPLLASIYIIYKADALLEDKSESAEA